MNSIMKTKNVLAGLVLASSGLVAAGASAVPIAAWNWESDGGFVIGGSTCDTGGEASCDLEYDNTAANAVTPSGVAGTASIMTWGTPSNGNGEKSGLQGVFGASTEGPHNAELLGSGDVWVGDDGDPAGPFGQIITNGGWTNTGAAVHYNNVITVAGGFMTSSTLSTTFQLLTPGPQPVIETDLDIQFDETLNSGSCPDGNPHGTVCDDVFTMTGALNPFSFTIGGQLYKASFRFANGPGAIVDGNTVYTAETSPGTSVIYVQGRIDTVPVPGVLALMGMGLMMVGWRVRRRKLV